MEIINKIVMRVSSIGWGLIAKAPYNWKVAGSILLDALEVRLRLVSLGGIVPLGGPTQFSMEKKKEIINDIKWE